MDFGQINDLVEDLLLDLPAGTTSLIPGAVNEAVKDACRRHNFRCMEEELLPVTVDQQRELTAKPSDWKEKRGEPYYYRQDGSTQPISWAPSESDMTRTYAIQLPDEGNTAPADEGAPRYLLERESAIDVFPLPDNESDWNNGNYRVVVPYWKYLPTMTADANTNFFTLNHEYYLIYKGASIIFLRNRDEERGNFYAGQAEGLFMQLKSQDKRSRLGDRITLAASPNVYSGRPRSGYREG